MQKRENASAVNDPKGRKVDMMKGLGKVEVGGGGGIQIERNRKLYNKCTRESFRAEGHRRLPARQRTTRRCWAV